MNNLILSSIDTLCCPSSVSQYLVEVSHRINGTESAGVLNQAYGNIDVETLWPRGLLFTTSSHIWLKLDSIAQWISQAPEFETKTNWF